jgi:hypothetical protein
MKHIYSKFPLFLLASGLLAGSVQAQSSTTIGNGDCSQVVQNFNSNSGGHASPSIYGGMFDSAFYYNSSLGYWTEMDGGRRTGPQSPRVVSIISQPYANPSAPTIFDVGFWYQTPSAVIDRFQVRLVAISPGPSGTTVTNIVASSGVQSFASRSPNGFMRRVDVANPANSGDTGRICIRLMDPDITNGPNTFYRVEIAYVLNTPGIDNFFAAYDNLAIGPVTSAAPLPVNFIGIVANREDNGGVTVRWDVSDETNVREYQLEKSTDGGTFTTAGTVTARQHSVYSYTDLNAKAPVIYYRIKSVDIDGRAKFSGIIKIVNNTSYSGSVKVYPTPAQSQITLQHSQLDNKARITITTMDGRVLKLVTPSAGASNTPIDISSLSAGMYVVRLDHGNGRIESTTFVKQ